MIDYPIGSRPPGALPSQGSNLAAAGGGGSSAVLVRSPHRPIRLRGYCVRPSVPREQHHPRPHRRAGFNMALEASSVVDDFEADERRTGITIFVPSTTPSPASLPVILRAALLLPAGLPRVHQEPRPAGQPTFAIECTVAGCVVPPVLGGANINAGVDGDGAVESCDVEAEAVGLCNRDAGRCRGEDVIAGVRVQDAEERTP